MLIRTHLEGTASARQAVKSVLTRQRLPLAVCLQSLRAGGAGGDKVRMVDPLGTARNEPHGTPPGTDRGSPTSSFAGNWQEQQAQAQSGGDHDR